jgi:UPF0755 protein
MIKRGPKYILSGIGVTILLILILIYRSLFRVGIATADTGKIIYIPTGAYYLQVKDSLKAHLLVKNEKLFDWISQKKNYQLHIKPGKYIIDRNISYISLINLLRSGRQTPVEVTFSFVRTINDLAGRIGGKIEADSAALVAFFADPDNYRKDGFTRETVISVFIPNTYEFYWNTQADGFYIRMHKEYKIFWNDQRLKKAREKGLNPTEVAILASIIDDEVVKSAEKPRIAGVYLNRLKRGIPLQACPTIKYALNDFTITRVLKKHLQIDSPYNTYKYKGFPPGPISCPSIEGIEAVLNAEQHDYLFFAAKADFSGYHNFSRTLAEHNHYAALYQRELDKKKIFK